MSGIPSSGSPQRRRFLVCEEDERERLDVYLQRASGDLSRSRVQSLIGGGAVLVNAAPQRASYRVRIGDEIGLDVPPPVELAARPQDLPLAVLYEDADLLVVDKPAGMAVHPAPGTPDGTLVNALLHHCRDLSGVNGVLRPGIVHRLDRDTTGLLMVAKTDAAHRGLAAQLEARAVERRYVALAWGRVRAAGTVDAALDRNPRDRMRMAVRQGGRRAVTHYEPTEALAFLTALALRLETGRTHQIRIHLQHIGHPVFGDPVYGGRTRVGNTDARHRAAAQQLLAGIDRQALHAATLGFAHPRTGEAMRFSSDLPGDLARTLAAARQLAAG